MVINSSSTSQPSTYQIEPNSGAIPNIGRVKRVLKLIAYLNEWRNIKEIAACIDVNKKTVHRYISLLTELGFIVEQQRRYRVTYRVANTAEFFGLTGKVDRMEDKTRITTHAGEFCLSIKKEPEPPESKPSFYFSESIKKGSNFPKLEF